MYWSEMDEQIRAEHGGIGWIMLRNTAVTFLIIEALNLFISQCMINVTSILCNMERLYREEIFYRYTM